MNEEPKRRYQSESPERELPVDHARAAQIQRGLARLGAGTSGDARGSAGTIAGRPGGAGTTRQSSAVASPSPADNATT